MLNEFTLNNALNRLQEFPLFFIESSFDLLHQQSDNSNLIQFNFKDFLNDIAIVADECLRE